MKKTLKASLALVLLVLVSGCASTGSSSFGCDGQPGGVNCAPASDLYNLVDKPGNERGVTQADIDGSKNPYVQRSGGSGESTARSRSRRGAGSSTTTGKETRSGEQVGPAFSREPIIPRSDPDQLMLVNPPASDPRNPHRTQSVTQRVWVAPWVNNTGAWHGEQVFYVEIEGREWQNGVIGGGSSMPIFKPLD